MRTHKEPCFRIERFNFVFGKRKRFTRDRFQISFQFIPCRQKFLSKDDGCTPAGGDHLSLVPLRRHNADIMPDHVLCFLRNQQRRLKDITLGAVFCLDHRQFLIGVIPEHVLKQLIQTRRILDQAVGRAPFIKNGHGGAVKFGVLEQVLVDEIAEDLPCFGLFLAQNRSARKTDNRRIGQGSAKVAVQRPCVRTMGLIHKNENFF